MLKKKLKYKFLILIFAFSILIPNMVFASNESNSNSIFDEQVKNFGINDFLKETKKYTEDLDVSNILILH